VSAGQESKNAADRVFDRHHNDRSSRWLYPNLLGSGTSCRPLLPRLDWNGLAQTTSRPRSPRRETTDPTHGFRHLPPGPPRPFPRESEWSQPHPRCLLPVDLTEVRRPEQVRRIYTCPRQTPLVPTSPCT
jgi:hypothetical protein